MINQGVIHEFKGTHYEMGFQQGQIFKHATQEMLDIFLDLDDIKALKPWFLPKNLFLRISSKKAFNAFQPIVEKYAPNQAQRIKGLSEGSGLKEETLYLFSAAELMLAELDWELPHLKSGCTSIAYQGDITESGHTMVSRNFDYARFIVPFLMLRTNRPQGLNATYDLTAMVLPGTFNGLNEHGVFISTDEAFPLDEIEEGLSASLLIQEALETCKSTEEVVEFFTNSARGSGNVILIADSEDDVRVMEYTSKQIHVRNPSPGDNFIVGTNHYTIDELKPIDLPREAIFGKKSPKPLRGICINETSYVRKDIAERLIRNADQIDLNFIKALHRDHSVNPKGVGGMETLCHHDPINISAASMIMDLKNFNAWICLGLPCKNNYKSYNLKSNGNEK